MVEHEGRAAAAQTERREEEGIRRVTGVHDVERPALCEAPNQSGSPTKSGAVFPRVAKHASAGRVEWEAMNLDAVDDRGQLGVAPLPLRTDHRDGKARL